MRSPTIADSLERLGAQDGDITDAVYARLFALHPETRDLLVDDGARNARGAMLAQVVELLLSLEAGEPSAASAIRSDISRHATDFDTDPALFAGFFAIVRDTVHDRLGPDWTATDETAWTAVLARTAALTA